MNKPDTFAIATPSYAGDLQRCVLLCASIDRFVTGHTMHYLLIEDRDADLFRHLEGPRRRIIVESELLPRWFSSWSDPLSLGRRRIWTSPGALARGVPPLRGWHAQQLRKMALPRHVPEDVLLFADSDVIFLKPFAMGLLCGPEGTRLFRAPGAIDAGMSEHVHWHRTTSAMIDRPMPELPAPDYVTHLASWRSANALALTAHIEAVSGRDWVSAVSRHRRFSEYMIYGRFIDAVLTPEQSGHAMVDWGLARSFWSQADIATHGLHSLQDQLGQGQVAVGVQSFLGEPIEKLHLIFETLAATSRPASA